MNRPISNPTSPIDDTPDRILDHLVDAHLAAPADELAPSSGFVASVMDSIHAEAIEPPPIAFPWRRVIPGAIAVLCALIALAVFVVRAAREASAPPSAIFSALTTHGLFTLSAQSSFTWMLLAVALSVSAVYVSLRLTRHRE